MTLAPELCCYPVGEKWYDPPELCVTEDIL